MSKPVTLNIREIVLVLVIILSVFAALTVIPYSMGCLSAP